MSIVSSRRRARWDATYAAHVRLVRGALSSGEARAAKVRVTFGGPRSTRSVGRADGGAKLPRGAPSSGAGSPPRTPASVVSRTTRAVSSLRARLEEATLAVREAGGEGKRSSGRHDLVKAGRGVAVEALRTRSRFLRLALACGLSEEQRVGGRWFRRRRAASASARRASCSRCPRPPGDGLSASARELTGSGARAVSSLLKPARPRGQRMVLCFRAGPGTDCAPRGEGRRFGRQNSGHHSPFAESRAGFVTVYDARTLTSVWTCTRRPASIRITPTSSRTGRPYRRVPGTTVVLSDASPASSMWPPGPRSGRAPLGALRHRTTRAAHGGHRSLRIARGDDRARTWRPASRSGRGRNLGRTASSQFVRRGKKKIVSAPRRDHRRGPTGA